MHKRVLAADRVLLLLSLVPYLREHGPTKVAELATAFDTTPELVRDLVSFLGTAGVPGETLTYQDEDLFDIDWDALEEHDVVSLTRTVAVDDAPRFSSTEVAALVAGLQMLTSVLPADHADAARHLAERLGLAFGADAARPAVSVSAEPSAEGLRHTIAALEQQLVLTFEYRDAEARVTKRTVRPIEVVQREGVWYLRGFCFDRGAERSFRVEQMREIGEADPPQQNDAAAPAVAANDAHSEQPTRAFDLVASLPAADLPRIATFEPEVIETEGDRVRVRIEAWYEGAAIRLLQQAPGTLVIEAPESARFAVCDWAARALRVTLPAAG